VLPLLGKDIVNNLPQFRPVEPQPLQAIDRLTDQGTRFGLKLIA
jgi:hypothetical protein